MIYDIHTSGKLFSNGKFTKRSFQNHTVQKLFEELTYANDFNFTFGNTFSHIHLNSGTTEIQSAKNKTA